MTQFQCGMVHKPFNTEIKPTELKTGTSSHSQHIDQRRHAAHDLLFLCVSVYVNANIFLHVTS